MTENCWRQCGEKSMNKHSLMLAKRRHELLAQSNAHRSALKMHGTVVKKSASRIELGLRVINRLKAHPEWIAGIALGVKLVTPQRLSLGMRFCTQGLRLLHMHSRR